jgi:hypothetical protein
VPGHEKLKENDQDQDPTNVDGMRKPTKEDSDKGNDRNEDTKRDKKWLSPEDECSGCGKDRTIAQHVLVNAIERVESERAAYIRVRHAKHNRSKPEAHRPGCGNCLRVRFSWLFIHVADRLQIAPERYRRGDCVVALGFSGLIERGTGKKERSSRRQTLANNHGNSENAEHRGLH